MTSAEMCAQLAQLDLILIGFLPHTVTPATRADIERLSTQIAMAVHHLESGNYCGWIASVIWEIATGSIKVLRTMEQLDLIPRQRALAEAVSVRALNN